MGGEGVKVVALCGRWIEGSMGQARSVLLSPKCVLLALCSWSDQLSFGGALPSVCVGKCVRWAD